MKPLQLKIQAFGPFAQCERVDFTELGAHPLFLINGTTGSGKSTLLDAMAFALYGDTTGNEREAADMRCQYADDETLTEVEFVFQLGANTYRIERRPQQERKKSRGEGMTTQNAEAFLYQVNADGSESLLVSKKLKEFNEKIIELIGLNSEQFRQVMVLPQGLFRKLLLADSKDREPILSQLFQTHIYKRVEDQIKAQAAQVSRQKQAQLEQVKGILRSADCNTRDDLMQRLEQVQLDFTNQQQCKQQAAEQRKKVEQAFQQAQQLAQKFAKKEQLLQQQQAHLAGQSHIDQRQQKVRLAQNAQKILADFKLCQQLEQTLHHTQSQLVQDQTQCQQAQTQLQQTEYKLEQAQQAYQNRDPLQQQLQQLKQLQPKLEALSQAEQQYAQRQDHLDAQYQAHQTALHQLEQHKQQRQNRLERKHQLEQQPFHEASLVAQIHQQQDLIAQHQAWLKLKQNQQKGLQNLAQKQAECQQAQTAYEQQQTTVNRLEYHWHLGQAAILAQTLQPDQACPVCGSHDHPNPAQWQQDIQPVDKASIEKAKAELNRLHQAWLAIQQQVNTQQTQLDAIQQQLEALPTQSADLSQLNAAHLQAELKDLNAQLAAGRQQQTALAQLMQDLQQIEHALQTQQNRCEQTQQAWQQAQTQLELAKQSVNHLQQDIPQAYRDNKALTAEMARLSQQITQLEQNYQAALQAKEQAQTQSIRYQQTLSERQTQIQHQQAQWQQAQADWQAVLTASDFADQAAFSAALVDETRYQAWLTELEQYHQQTAKLEGALHQLQTELAGLQPPDLANLEAQSLAEQQVYQQVEDAFNQVNIELSKLKNVQSLLAQSDQTNQALEAEYKVIGTLSEVLSGDNNAKVSLQRFVLGVLLDDVLHNATDRLRNMTRGRYDLIRKDTRSKGLKASGLELEVFDSYTGKSRHVATLSGGESFLAALALALGLSDVVQSYAGGIKLDTLFIDEGFGSLDPESLELAIDTLKSLQIGGRTIGIISHVQELKEQMPLRIDITATAQGSHIKVVGV